MNTYLGIDLHKRSSTWMLIDENNKLLKQAVVSYQKISLEEAVKYFGIPTRTTLEPVGAWRLVSDYLEECGHEVSIANPYKIRLIADSKQKTDKKDALTLAELLRLDYLPESHKCSEDIFNLRTLIRHRAYLVRTRAGLKNRIHGIVTKNGLLEDLNDNPLQKVGKERILNGNNQELKQLLELVNFLDLQVDSIEDKLKLNIKNNTIIKLLMTMPGIGIVTGCAIYSEVSDFKRFNTSKQLISYAGLNPSQRSSGESIKYGRISKSGSKILRYSIVEASFRIRNVPKSKSFYDFYFKLKEKKGAKLARVALSRKMLTVLWYMVKNNTPYQDNTLTRAQSGVNS